MRRSPVVDTNAAMSVYAPIVKNLLSRYAVQVHRWRDDLSGCAWSVLLADGTSIRWIESPHPQDVIGLSIFLHEIGHHVIGFERFKRRCEEEYHVWQWALAEMRRLRIEPDQQTLARVEASLRYAVEKAVQRGIKSLPHVLQPYADAEMKQAA